MNDIMPWPLQGTFFSANTVLTLSSLAKAKNKLVSSAWF